MDEFSLNFLEDDLNSACNQMIVKLTEDMTVSKMVEYLSELLGSTVIIYSKTMSYVLSSCDDSATRGMLRLIREKLGTAEKLDSFLLEHRTVHLLTKYDGIYLDCYDNSIKSAALSGELHAHGETMGTLCLLDVDVSDYFEKAEMLQIFCNILSEKLYSDYAIQELPHTSGKSGFSDINSGAKWLRKIQGDVFQNFYIAVIDKVHTSDARISMLRDKMEQHAIMFRMLDQSPYITFLFNVRNNADADIMRSILSREGTDTGTSIALSSRFCSTERIHAAYSQAVETLQTAANLKLTSGLFEFEILCADVLLYEFMRTANLDIYRSEALDKLCEFDEKNMTQYYETLKCYLFCGGSKQRASNALFVHRNTLTYRLERTEELLNLSLGDFDVQTKLWFDIKIKEALDAVK